MWRSGLLVFLSLAGCQPGTTRSLPPAPPSIPASYEPLAMFFDLPVNWHAELTDEAYIMSGAPGTPGFYTTVVLQQYDATPPPALDTLLVSNYAALPAAEQPTFLFRQPAVIDSTLGLCYGLRVVNLDTMFRKLGVIALINDHILDLSFNAPEDHFEQAAADFQMILDSVTFEGQK